MADAPAHLPVLLKESLELLAPQAGETFVDCTVGQGGHTTAFAERLGPSGRIVGFDLDPQNLHAARERLAGIEQGPVIELVHANFVEAPDILRDQGITADMVLADLGFASSQMDNPDRGFSFRHDGPLDMRLNPNAGRTAADLVNTLSEAELADVIFQWGEDPFARRIARKLVAARRNGPIESTAVLARLVREAYGSRARHSRMDPATRTFMALRIAVNDELVALERLLTSIQREVKRFEAEADARSKGADTGESERGWLAAGARVGIISFHSLEDRMVKRAFVDVSSAEFSATRITRKPVTATADEIARNPRARSAKLRVLRMPGSSHAA